MNSLFIVIAAHSEARVIGSVIDQLKNAGYRQIIVVDDGSKDNTAKIAEQHGAFVVKHVINCGQGAALRTGTEVALKKGADIVVHFDADGQHRVEDLPAMIAPVQQRVADVVLGSRFLARGSNVPLLRKIFLQAGALLFRLLYGVKLTDSHNGFRALSRFAAETIKIKTSRMEHASEIIDQINRHGLRYCEVPVTIRYTDYSLSHSSQGMFPALRILYRTLAHKFMR